VRVRLAGLMVSRPSVAGARLVSVVPGNDAWTRPVLTMALLQRNSYDRD
jgi:hypothetical protein